MKERGSVTEANDVEKPGSECTSPCYAAIVVKEFCDLDGNWSTHCRKMTFPIPPVVGMGVIVNPDADPLDIEQVFVNSKGEIVVCVECDSWKHEKGNFNGDWESQRAYQLDGWELLEDRKCGVIKLY